MEKKNTVLLTVIAVSTLLIAVVGATFAYFTASETNAGGTTTVTATAESVGAVTLTNETGDLHLRLSASDMAQDNLGVYWATDVQDANYDEEMELRNIATATLTGGSDSAKYTCSAIVNVAVSGTMASALQKGDAYIQFGGLLTDKVDLTEVSSTGYAVTFNLDGSTVKSQSVSAAVAIENRNAEQDDLAGKNLSVTFSNTGFSCQVVKEDDAKNLSQTIMALAGVEGSGVYREDYTAINRMKINGGNIINSTDGAWENVDSSGIGNITLSPGENFIYSIDLLSNTNSEEGLYLEGSVTFKPKTEDNYIIFLNDVSPNITHIYVNNSEIELQAIDPNLEFIEEFSFGSGYILGELGTGDTIRIEFAEDYYETAGIGLVTYESIEQNYTNAGYRYEGADVNNYVIFNNETWRIVGVEYGNLVGTTTYYGNAIENGSGFEEGKYYTKIVRDSYEPHVHYVASIENLINETSFSMTKKMYHFEEIEDRNGNDINTGAANQRYKYRYYQNEKLSIGNYYNVTLLTLSDYGFAALQSDCGKVDLVQYNNGCASKNWLFTGTAEHLLASFDGMDTGYIIDENGNVAQNIYENNNGKTYQYRPVVYLDPNVVITNDGDGSINNKYEIALNS